MQACFDVFSLLIARQAAILQHCPLSPPHPPRHCLECFANRSKKTAQVHAGPVRLAGSGHTMSKGCKAHWGLDSAWGLCWGIHRAGAWRGQCATCPLATWPAYSWLKKGCRHRDWIHYCSCPLIIQDRVSQEFLIEINLERVSSISAMLRPSTHNFHSTLHSILSTTRAPLIQNVTHNGLKRYLDSV